MQWQTGDDFSAGGFLNEPGGYHLIITAVEENPSKKGGQLIDNAAFRITCQALAGTVPGTEGKLINLLFFWPKTGGKDDGAFARKKIDRFLLAVSLLDEQQKGQQVDINVAQAVGRQFKVNLEHDDDQKHVQIAFADIFHVDDPAAKHIPVDEKTLKLLPAAWRRIGKGAIGEKSKAAKPGPKAEEEFEL